MNNVVGSIPSKIYYISHLEKEEPIGCVWDSSEISKKETVLPVVVSTENTDSKLESVARLFSDYNNKVLPADLKVEEIDNKVISNLKLLSISYKIGGGISYKVKSDDYLFCFRTEEMMEAILETGIKPQGNFPGSYIWAKIYGVPRLIRTGSEVHAKILKYQQRSTLKPISKSKLEVGGVYKSKNGNRSVFLGYIDSIYLALPHDFWSSSKKEVIADYTNVAYKKMLLFYSLGKKEAAIDIGINTFKDKLLYYVNAQQTHSFIEKLESVNVESSVISDIRSLAIQQVADELMAQSSAPVWRSGPRYISSMVSRWSILLNMTPYQGSPISIFDLKSYLPFL